MRRSRNLSSPNFQDIHTAHLKSTTTVTNNTAAPTTIETSIATDRNNPIEVKRKSLLNASYSSEEILLQAASSLQGLEGKYIWETQGGNLAIFLSVNFYVKSILADFRRTKSAILTILKALNFKF